MTEQEILQETMVYFSSQRRLATVEELYRYQIRGSISRERISSIMDSIPSVQYGHGVYGFKDEFDLLLKLRQEKQRETLRRLRKIKRYGRLLCSVPYVRAIFLAGSLTFSTGNAKESSDIDIFVVMAPNRIWIGRFLLTAVAQVMGIRRRGDFDENLFCLNHYVTSDNLARIDHDLYAAELYSDYIALGEQSYRELERFWTQNSWVKSYFPKNTWRYYPGISDVKHYPGSRRFEAGIEFLGGELWDNVFGKIQRRKIRMNHLSQTPEARIQVTDQELEFHPHPNSNRIQSTMVRRKSTLGI